MARSKIVSAVSTPAPTTTTTGSKLDGAITPPNPNSGSEFSPLSKAMEPLDIRPFSLDFDTNAINMDLPESRLGPSMRSKLVEEETTLEDRIVDLILDGQWELLQPNSGKSVVLGDGKSVSVSYQEEPGSGYRTWEWHGHVMVYEDGEGYVPEYVYGNYFEPLEDDYEPDFISMNRMNSMNSMNRMNSMNIMNPRLRFGGYFSGLGFTH